MGIHVPDMSEGHQRNPLARILDLAPALLQKLTTTFASLQDPESIDAVIASARKMGYFDDGGEMFLLLAHKFQSLTEDSGTCSLALDGLSNDTLRILGTNRVEVQIWMEAGILNQLRDFLENARSTDIKIEDKGERIPERPRGFLEGEEEFFVAEAGRISGHKGMTLTNIEDPLLSKLGTSREELLSLRTIGILHRATWLISQARQDGHLIGDNWVGLMTYLSDAQGEPSELRLESITKDTLTLAGLSRGEVQSWFCHIPE